MKNKIVLLVVFLAAVLRLWNLGGNPPHMTPDEAALGYNAYSILKTGKDEYGEFLPVIFKSFGDYKPGLYVYLTVPSVSFFGLTEFAVRFPSALAGVVSVWLIYLIVRSLFADKRLLPVISAFVMAINPWSIYFSRGAWEVNVALTLTLAGIYLFLRSFEKPKLIIFSSLFFALTLITYQGAKLSTGIVVLILLFIYWKKIVSIKSKYIFLSGILGILVSLPILFSLFQGKAGRLEVFSVFSYPRPKEYLEEFLSKGGEDVGSLSYYVFHSETLNFTRGVLGRYFNHFSARFLFFEGDWANPRHSAPNHGMLLLSDILFLMIGITALLRYGIKKETLFVWAWLILSPLPSVLSRDQVHAIRSFNLAVPLSIVISLGLYNMLTFVKTKKFRLVGYVFVISIYSLSLTYFFDAYFVHLPRHDSKYWEYGYREIVEIITPIQNNYRQIKVQQSFAQPYIYFLFYQKYDPEKYQRQAELAESEYKGDVGYVENLDNICFCPIDWSVNRGESGTLFVGDTIRIPPEDSKSEELFKEIAEIKYLNGRDTSFRIIEVK